MKKSQKLRIEKSVKDTITVISVTTVAFIVFSTLLVLFFGPNTTTTTTMTVYAEQTDTIKAARQSMHR